MIGLKSSSMGHLGLKNIGNKLLGGAKSLSSFADSPLGGAIIGLVSPELAAGVQLAKRSGVLEKIKNY